MDLLKQIFVTVLATAPLPLGIALANIAGGFTMMFVLVSQLLIASIVFTVYFHWLVTSSGGSKGAAFARALFTSLIVAVAILFERPFCAYLGSLDELLFSSSFSAASNIFDLIVLFLYFSLSVAASVVITYWIVPAASGRKA